MNLGQNPSNEEQTSYRGALGLKTQSSNKGKIRLQHRKHEIINGKPVVTFTKEEHDLLAETCKWTLIGYFCRNRPQIDKIRANFTRIMPTKGQVKIGAKDSKHVFIDAENEEDYKLIASYNYVQLSEGHSMKIQRWTPNFKPNKNTSMALVWINLPGLPWHYYEWATLCRIVGPIGTPIVMDKATQTKTRPTTTKMRIEIDLLKPMITDVQVTIQNPEVTPGGTKKQDNKARERKQNKNEMHHHNLRVRKNRNDHLTYIEDNYQQTQSNKEYSNRNDANNRKRVTSKKQKLKDKVRTTKEAATNGEKSVHQGIYINFPLIQNIDNITGKTPNLTSKARDQDTLKEQEGNDQQKPEAKPPDSIEDLYNVPVNLVETDHGDNLNQELFMECIKVELGKSLSDDEVIRRDTSKYYSEEELGLQDKKQTKILINNNLSPRNQDNMGEMRRELWSDLRNLASTIQEPWGVIGDFNVIMNREEKFGGRPHILEESLEFIECLNDCGLQDAGYTGAKLTWCDNRDPPLTIWKRLGRLVYNSNWFELNNTAVTHLSRSCSDHALLLVKLHHEDTQGTRYFKFLNFWTEHPDFKQTVQNSWNIYIHGNPLYILQQKIKNTTKALSTWSRDTFGDIYEEPKRLESLIRDLEEICMTNNTPENRSELWSRNILLEYTLETTGAAYTQIQQTSSITVRWLRPPAQIVKLNSDGSCTNGQCGGGGIIRNQEGKFIMAYSIPLGEGTSNYAEAEALLFGLKWCADRDLKMAIGESDSLLIVKCVKGSGSHHGTSASKIKRSRK
ncbi:hypothetical protein A4A49_27518 [Nicotiana attenuata]|uniref:Uncharacterized protein n=1 Tax=Nicotiana attenuata TaxID=49451 RepID=A0A314KNM6_NICAT|nr:hypothetical protein A4A49_27518 [Nicotiana attenuata]